MAKGHELPRGVRGHAPCVEMQSGPILRNKFEKCSSVYTEPSRVWMIFPIYNVVPYIL